jgi:hypothetical protein
MVSSRRSHRERRECLSWEVDTVLADQAVDDQEEPSCLGLITAGNGFIHGRSAQYLVQRFFRKHV